MNIIFDFDGTIADSLPVAMDLFYQWAKVEPFPPAEVNRLRNMSLREVIKDVGLPLWRVPSLLVKARSQFGKRLADVAVFEGMTAVLAQLHTDGNRMYVISSNSPLNIRRFLKKNKIDHYFIGIQGNIGLFGKAATMRLIMRKHKIKPADCISIGDEARDVDAAKKAHIKCIAVTWGYNAEQILRDHKPDYVAQNPAELLKLLQ